MGAAAVVREFCAAIDRKDLHAVEALMDENVVYHNIGAKPAVGREASLAAVKFQLDMFDPIEFRLRNIAADGDVVLTERVDEITANGITAPVPVMGTFEVRDGRIVHWRDYFDIGLTGKLMGGEDVSALLPQWSGVTDESPGVTNSDAWALRHAQRAGEIERSAIELLAERTARDGPSNRRASVISVRTFFRYFESRRRRTYRGRRPEPPTPWIGPDLGISL